MVTVSNLSTATGLTVSQVRTAIEKLADSNSIKVKTTNKYSVIKIIDFEAFL